MIAWLLKLFGWGNKEEIAPAKGLLVDPPAPAPIHQPQPDIPEDSPIPDWIVCAEKEIGVKEIRGGETKRILEYHQATSLGAKEDEIPWCSSFVNWVMKSCGYKRTDKANARSWLDYGTKLNEFQQYAIVVFKRGSLEWQGHVAFAIEDEGSTIKCLGGNQSDQVCYATYKKSDVLGYRWPVKEPDQPVKPTPLASTVPGVRDLSLGYSLIKEFESLELKAYPDPATGGKPWTIGWGTTVYPNGDVVKKGDVCTRAQAEQYFQHDCSRFMKAVAACVTKPINDNQFGALLSFAYNVGERNLKNSTLVKRVNIGAPNSVIEAEFMKWTKANGKVMNGLIRRRKMEAVLYRTPVVVQQAPA